MPQVDLATVCGGGHDRKITCETLADDDPTTTTTTVTVESSQPDPEPLPDYAPESFWLSKDAELDWLSENAYIERKGSGRGLPHPHSTNLNPNPHPHPHPHPHPNSASQRYSVNLISKASMIGLPKSQKATYAESKLRRNFRPASIRFFPKRGETSSGKSGVTVTEPTSPKVSCMGRVRSKKDRGRRMRNRQNQPELESKRSRSIRKTKTGFWSNFRALFRPGGGKADCAAQEEAVRRKKGSLKKQRESKETQTEPAEPPGLGAVQRFTSGRKSAAWAADLEVDGSKSEPLDRCSIWERRRDGGPLHDIHVDRQRQCVSVGPVSV